MNRECQMFPARNGTVFTEQPLFFFSGRYKVQNKELYVITRVCHLKKKKEFLKRIDKRFQGLFLFNFLKVPNSSYGMVL